MCVFACVCVWEREIEREWVCVRERGGERENYGCALNAFFLSNAIKWVLCCNKKCNFRLKEKCQNEQKLTDRQVACAISILWSEKDDVIYIHMHTKVCTYVCIVSVIKYMDMYICAHCYDTYNHHLYCDMFIVQATDLSVHSCSF